MLYFRIHHKMCNAKNTSVKFLTANFDDTTPRRPNIFIFFDPPDPTNMN